METAYQIFEYLPLKYKIPNDSEYFSFLIQSVEQNHKAKNYHFAVAALHMIYMGIVYHYIYGIFRADKKRFDHILIGFHQQLEEKGKVRNFDDIAWQNFSIIHESEIFQFYRAVGITKEEIGNLKAPVKKRNDVLHTNGIYLASETDFEKQSESYLRNLNKIHEFCFNEYKKLFYQFLDEIQIEIADKNEAGQYLEEDFIQEFGVNPITIQSLSAVDKSKYPTGKELFYESLQDKIVAFQ